MSPADPAVAGVRDAGEGFPLLPAAGLHPRGLHSPPRTGETTADIRSEISLMQVMFDYLVLLSCTLLVNKLSSPRHMSAYRSSLRVGGIDFRVNLFQSSLEIAIFRLY